VTPQRGSTAAQVLVASNLGKRFGTGPPSNVASRWRRARPIRRLRAAGNRALPDLTAQENPLRPAYGLRGKASNHRVGKVLDLIGLSERSRDRVESFSRGMKRRLNIGAGLLYEPTLLVLDEPTWASIRRAGTP
jgi:ABC-type branched-subunit amino acid transport system ATPase component